MLWNPEGLFYVYFSEFIEAELRQIFWGERNGEIFPLAHSLGHLLAACPLRTDSVPLRLAVALAFSLTGYRGRRGFRAAPGHRPATRTRLRRRPKVEDSRKPQRKTIILVPGFLPSLE